MSIDVILYSLGNDTKVYMFITDTVIFLNSFDLQLIDASDVESTKERVNCTGEETPRTLDPESVLASDL